VLKLLLFALAWLGHACLLMAVVNHVYGRPLHKHFLKAFRLLSGVVIFAFPAGYYLVFGTDALGAVRSAFDTHANLPAVAYLLLTLAVAVVILPFITVRRLFRPRPASVIGEATVTVDVAKELGGPPYGDGEAARMARLPFNDIFRVDFTTLTVAPPGLPAAWDGLTLLQVSDLHFYGTPARSFFEFVMRRALADGVPDLVCLTGDVVDGDEYCEWIAPVLGQLRWNVAAFAILGNHDWWQDAERVRAKLRGLGMRVFGNAWERHQVRGEPLTVIGHEGPWFRPEPDLTGCPADGFRLLLSHSPDNYRWARQHRIDLMLSGHAHGGQVRLPLFGSIFVPCQTGRRYDTGTFHEPPTLLHVNRGLSGKEPIRFRCNPQVTRIVLMAKN
jgi:predicted MPP superfamily phosphohydrolase